MRLWFGRLPCALLPVLCLCACVTSPLGNAPLTLARTAFAALAGWQTADLDAARAAFARSCAKRASAPGEEAQDGAGYAGTPADWRAACDRATDSSIDARTFFETAFVPYRLSQGAATTGLVTGYFEPELKGSRTRHGPYQTPLYGLPTDLVTVDLGLFRDRLKGQRLAGRVANSQLVPYASRAEIERDGLPTAQPLFYVDDPVAAFFLQVQGSGRIALDDGTVVRAVYAGTNGWPYSSIGARLVEEGAIPREQMSLFALKAWLAAHPDRAQAVMEENASYVFFAEQPIGDPALGALGTEGVPLAPAVSLAVDNRIHPLGIPIWLDTTMPAADGETRPFDALLVAQDTGGAITGALRGDIYWGVGPKAEIIAGRMNSEGRFTVLLPRALATRLGARVLVPPAE